MKNIINFIFLLPGILYIIIAIFYLLRYHFYNIEMPKWLTEGDEDFFI